MSSIFSKIIKGEIPAYKVAENNDFLAFLDINPRTKGHTLVIPKQEVDYIFDLEDETYKGLFLFAKRVASALEKVIACERVAMAIVGLEVPHAHIHLKPINSMNDFGFHNPSLKLSSDQFETLSKAINQEFEALK